MNISTNYMAFKNFILHGRWNEQRAFQDELKPPLEKSKIIVVGVVALGAFSALCYFRKPSPKDPSEPTELQKVEEEVRALLPISYTRYITSIEAIGKGFSNNLYRIKFQNNTLVYRIPKQLIGFEAREQMISIARRCDVKKICPQIIATDTTKGTMIMEYLSKEWPLYLDNRRPYHSAMKVLKLFQETITENLEVKNFLPFNFIHQLVGNKLDLDSYPSQLGKAVLRIKKIENSLQPWLTKNYTACHGDFHKDNILIKSDEDVRIIDYDTVGVGHPYYDIAKFSVNLSWTDKVKLLESYLGIHPVKKQLAHLRLMHMCLLVVIAATRFRFAETLIKQEQIGYSKHEMEEMLQSKEPLPSFLQVSYADQSAKARQLGAIYALDNFIRDADLSLEQYIQDAL